MIELLQKIPRNLTKSSVLADKKEWVATAAMLAGSVASSLFGGAKAKKAAKKAIEEQKYRANSEKAWFEKEYNTDYIDTKAGQNLMRRAQDVHDSYVRKADGAAAVGGGTAASTAMAKEQANKAIGDTIANVAAQDTSRKAQVADKHQASMQQLSQERQATEQAAAQATSNAAQNMSDALMQGAVNQLGSELSGAKPLNKRVLSNSTSMSDNRMITSVGDGLAHKTNTSGMLNPVASRKTLLDDAVEGLVKRKPNVPHVEV